MNAHFYRPGERTGDALPPCLDCGESPTATGFGWRHSARGIAAEDEAHVHDRANGCELQENTDGTLRALVWCSCGANYITQDPFALEAAWDARYPDRVTGRKRYEEADR